MWIANDDQQCMSSSDCNVEAFWVAKEAKCVPQVNVHQRLLRANLHQPMLTSIRSLITATHHHFTLHKYNCYYTICHKLPSTARVKKIPPRGFLKFFPKRLGIFNQFLHTYYTIISTLEYKFLFKYLQL